MAARCGPFVVFTGADTGEARCSDRVGTGRFGCVIVTFSSVALTVLFGTVGVLFFSSFGLGESTKRRQEGGRRMRSRVVQGGFEATVPGGHALEWDCGRHKHRVRRLAERGVDQEKKG